MTNTSIISISSQNNAKIAAGKAVGPGFTVGRLIGLSAQLLKDVGISSSILDAQLLLGAVLKKNRIEVQLSSHAELSGDEASVFWSYIKRRLCGEPVAYILGCKEFYGLDFLLTKDCLIPRPDTEVVVEKCLSKLLLGHKSIVFDVCTGSGAIAIALLHHRPDIEVYASDISAGALAMAQKNAENLGVGMRFKARLGDLFLAFDPKLQADLIVANPPYIKKEVMNSLSRDVRDYEPHLALFADDERGISFYERILQDAHQYLRPGGFLVLEIGFDQAEDIRKILHHWTLVEFFLDWAGNTRGLVLQKQ